MKKSFLLVISLILVVALFAVGCTKEPAGTPVASDKPTSSAPAQSDEAKDPPIKLRISTEVPDVTTRFEAVANRAFVDYLDKNPSIEVDYYPGAALGDQKAVYDQLGRGQVDIHILQASVIAGVDYPNFSIFDLPYLFSNEEAAKAVLQPDGPLSTQLREDYAEKTGVRLLCFTVNGFRNVTNSKREIKTPDDLKGIKLRTMSAPIQIAAWEAADVLVTPMAFTELYSAMQTGVVDGQENPVAVILSNSFNEVQKYMTMSRHLLSVGTLVMYEETYQKMTPAQQKHLDEAVQLYYDQFCDSCTAEDADMLKQIIDKNLMQVYEPTSEEIDAFRQVMQPAARELIEKNLDDPAFLDLLLEEVEKYN